MTPETEPKPLSDAILRRKGLVIGITALCTAALLVYTATSRPTWQADTTLVFPMRGPSVLGPAGIAEAAGLSAALTGGATPTRFYLGLLSSDRVLEYVSKKTGIEKKELQKNRILIDSSNQNTVTVSYRSKDADQAKKVVGSHLEILNVLNREIAAPLLGDDTKVLQSQLQAQQARLSEAEEALAKFQSTSKTAPAALPMGTDSRSTVALPADYANRLRALELDRTRIARVLQEVRAKAAQSAREPVLPTPDETTEKWRTRLTELEYQLQVRKLSAGEDDAQVKDLQESVRIARETLSRELAQRSQAIDAGVLDPTNSSQSEVGLTVQLTGLEAQIAALARLAEAAPGEAKQYGRLVREVATRSAIVQQLTTQLELSKIQTLRDPNRWQVLDAPYVLDEPTNKNYARNGVLGLLFGLFVGSSLALLLGAIDARRNGTSKK